MSEAGSAQAIGEARLAVLTAMRELRELVQLADVEPGQAWRKRMRLNDAAHRVDVAVRNFGFLLPR